MCSILTDSQRKKYSNLIEQKQNYEKLLRKAQYNKFTKDSCFQEQFIKQINCLTMEIKNIDNQIDNLLNQQMCICM